MKRFSLLLACSLAIIYFVIGIMTLVDYGINWDEPVHYIRGQAYLRYFLFGKKDYGDLPKIKSHYPKSEFVVIPKDITYEDDAYFRRSIYQYDQEKHVYSYQYFVDSPGSHPPLNGILASLSNYIFYQKLGIIGDVESYHLFVLLSSALLVFVVVYFSMESFGIFSGLITYLAIVTYPLFFAESHFNIKDPVEASFYGLTLYCFYKGIVKGNWKWILISSVCFGIALGTKLNALFIIPTIILWLLFYKWKEIRSLQWPFSKNITISIVFLPIIGFFIFYISYPNLWKDPITGLGHIVSYYKDIGIGISYQSESFRRIFGINTFPVLWILYTTPLVTLLLAIVGIFYGLFFYPKRRNITIIFILIWLLFPIIRVSAPQAGIYGGVRQIMEYIPAMALFAGLGAVGLRQCIKKIVSINPTIKRSILYKNAAVSFSILLLFIPISIKLIQIHPAENVYFNPLIGGLKGAKEKDFPYWGMTLGSIYKKGIDWMNKHAEPDAKIALAKGLYPNVPRVYIRKDISYTELNYSGNAKKGEYIMEVIDYDWKHDVPKEKRDYITTLKPVYEINVDDVPILTIWKNDQEHTKRK